MSTPQYNLLVGENISPESRDAMQQHLGQRSQTLGGAEIDPTKPIVIFGHTSDLIVSNQKEEVTQKRVALKTPGQMADLLASKITGDKSKVQDIYLIACQAGWQGSDEPCYAARLAHALHGMGFKKIKVHAATSPQDHNQTHEGMRVKIITKQGLLGAFTGQQAGQISAYTCPKGYQELVDKIHALEEEKKLLMQRGGTYLERQRYTEQIKPLRLQLDAMERDNTYFRSDNIIATLNQPEHTFTGRTDLRQIRSQAIDFVAAKQKGMPQLQVAASSRVKSKSRHRRQTQAASSSDATPVPQALLEKLEGLMRSYSQGDESDQKLAENISKVYQDIKADPLQWQQVLGKKIKEYDSFLGRNVKHSRGSSRLYDFVTSLAVEFNADVKIEPKYRIGQMVLQQLDQLGVSGAEVSTKTKKKGIKVTITIGGNSESFRVAKDASPRALSAQLTQQGFIQQRRHTGAVRQQVSAAASSSQPQQQAPAAASEVVSTSTRRQPPHRERAGRRSLGSDVVAPADSKRRTAQLRKHVRQQRQGATETIPLLDDYDLSASEQKPFQYNVADLYRRTTNTFRHFNKVELSLTQQSACRFLDADKHELKGNELKSAILQKIESALSEQIQEPDFSLDDWVGDIKGSVEYRVLQTRQAPKMPWSSDKTSSIEAFDNMVEAAREHIRDNIISDDHGGPSRGHSING